MSYHIWDNTQGGWVNLYHPRGNRQQGVPGNWRKPVDQSDCRDVLKEEQREDSEMGEVHEGRTSHQVWGDPYWRCRPDTFKKEEQEEPEMEEQTTSPTGGQKGTKPVRHGLIDPSFLNELALHAGLGAAKYSDGNWRKGYPLSLSYDALQRHANAWWAGESRDAELGTSHMAAVAFHAMVLFVNSDGIEKGVFAGGLPEEFDDRPSEVSLSDATSVILDSSPLWRQLKDGEDDEVVS